jgi:hypothetical protein
MGSIPVSRSTIYMLEKSARKARVLLWEKQPDESPPAFQAFAVYRHQGLGNRSTAKVSEELGKSLALIHRWSSRWKWVSRVESYDGFLDKQMRDRHLRELNEARDRHANLARLMQSKFLERLRDVPPDELPLAVLANMLKVATDVELRALGESTLKVETEITGPSGGPLRLSIDELAKVLEDSDYGIDEQSRDIEESPPGPN